MAPVARQEQTESDVMCSKALKGPFQGPWVIWVIRLTSPHLP